MGYLSSLRCQCVGHVSWCIKGEGDTYCVTTMAIHHPDPPVVVVRIDDGGDSDNVVWWIFMERQTFKLLGVICHC